MFFMGLHLLQVLVHVCLCVSLNVFVCVQLLVSVCAGNVCAQKYVLMFVHVFSYVCMSP
jgi:hypothetical protein